MTAGIFLVEGHQGNIFAKLRVTKGTFLPCYIEIGPVVSDNKIFKVYYIDIIGKISPAPLRPCFSTNHDGLNNNGRGSPREHFCQVIVGYKRYIFAMLY